MFCSIQCVARQEGRRLLLRRLCQTRNDLTIASQVVAPNNKPLPLINVDYDLQPFEVLIGQDQNLQKRARKDTSDEFELQWANIVCTLIWIADWCCFDKHRISGRNGACGRVAASMSMHCVDQHELDSCWIILDTLLPLSPSLSGSLIAAICFCSNSSQWYSLRRMKIVSLREAVAQPKSVCQDPAMPSSMKKNASTKKPASSRRFVCYLLELHHWCWPITDFPFMLCSTQS